MWQIANAFPGRSETIGTSRGNLTGVLIVPRSGQLVSSYHNIGNPTTMDYQAVLISGPANGNQGQYSMFNIGIKNSQGSVQVLANNLRHDATGKVVGASSWPGCLLPVFVPKSSQLCAAMRITNGTSGNGEIGFTGFTAAGYWGVSGSRIHGMGLNSATSVRGWPIDAGGTANTKGAVTVVASPVPANLRGLFLALGTNADIARTGSHRGFIDIMVGPVASAVVLIPNIPWTFESNMDVPFPFWTPLMPADVKSGAGLSARASCSSNTAGDRTFDLMIYGVE